MIARPLPSASHWDLLAICQAAAAYPWVDEVSPALEAGRERHSFYQRLGSGVGREQAIACAPIKWRAMLAQLPTERLDVEPGAYRCEVSFALNPETSEVRVLGEGLSRDVAYRSCPPGWIPMTTDRVGLTDAAIVTRDFKGPWDSAEHHWQLGLYALTSHIAFATSQNLVLRLIDRVGAGVGRVERLPDWDTLDLMAFEDRVLELARKVRAVMEDPASARPVVGPHCARCPARLACPAQRAAADVLMQREGEALSAGALRDLARAWPAFKARVRQVEELIKAEARAAYERGEPFTAPDGSQFRPWPTETPAHDDPDDILSVLWGMLPEDTDPEAADIIQARAEKVSRAVTSDGIYEVARALASRGKIKATAEGLREQLRKAGAITQREVIEWGKS
ncbi:MAG TPA: hypothetical protein VMY76_00830 [Gemmatimonadales bacterium]|nr:hypothetical protein [Gemmatimonadales bacterium]